MDLVRVLYEPGAVFERVRERARFFPPFIGLAVLVMVIQFLSLPYYRSAMASVYAQMAQQNPQAGEAAQRFAFVGVFFWPIILAVILLLSAMILWVLVSLFGGEGKFGTLLSVATYSSITFILTQAVSLLILVVKGKENLASPLDLQPPIGLTLLIPTSGRFATAFLNGINPFALWGLVLTAMGIAVTHKLSKGTAYTVAVIAMLFGLVIGAGLAATCAPKGPS